MQSSNKKFVLGAIVLVVVLAGIWFMTSRTDHSTIAQDQQSAQDKITVTITDKQAGIVKVETVKQQSFTVQRSAVGVIDFNQEHTVQVFTPYQGRITQVFVKAGDDVVKGQPLFAVDSPDLLQAVSNLISTAGLKTLTTRALERAKKMSEIQAASQKDFDQAKADQQTAEGNYYAARDAMRIFGKSDADMDKIIAGRKVISELVVSSPMRGRVVARNAQPGLLVQPGNAPAPITVADASTMWMIANVPELDLPHLKVGQELSISVDAYPALKYQGHIINIGASVDPVTRRITVRGEIPNKDNQLRAQMLASYVINTGAPEVSAAIAPEGIVREGDGTMTAFVTTDDRNFIKRVITIGMTQNQLVQVTSGLEVGEKVAGDGAIFLSNALALKSR
jgi:cobalt-zinc-cadmium efflux system membrane fusion protein